MVWIRQLGEGLSGSCGLFRYLDRYMHEEIIGQGLQGVHGCQGELFGNLLRQLPAQAVRSLSGRCMFRYLDMFVHWETELLAAARCNSFVVYGGQGAASGLRAHLGMHAGILV